MAVLMAFSMMTLPTVWETICNTSKIGTPLRMSEAIVRVKRARQILCAMEPKMGNLIRLASQNSWPDFVLMKENQLQMAAAARMASRINQCLTKSLMSIRTWVGPGNFAPKPE